SAAVRPGQAVGSSDGPSDPVKSRGDERKRRLPDARRRLSYGEQRELDRMPDHIEALESEHRALNERIAAPGFYKEAPSDIRAALARVSQLDRDLIAAYTRWEELTSRSEPAPAGPNDR